MYLNLAHNAKLRAENMFKRITVRFVKNLLPNVQIRYHSWRGDPTADVSNAHLLDDAGHGAGIDAVRVDDL